MGGDGRTPLASSCPYQAQFGQRQSLRLQVAAPGGRFLLPGGAACPLLCHPPLAGGPVFLAQRFGASAGRPHGPGTKPSVLLLLSPCHLPSPALRLLNPSAAQYRFLAFPLFPLAMVPPLAAGPPFSVGAPPAPAGAGRLGYRRRNAHLSTSSRKASLGQTYS